MSYYSLKCKNYANFKSFSTMFYSWLSAPEHEGYEIFVAGDRAGRNVNLKCIIHKDSGSYLYI